MIMLIKKVRLIAVLIILMSTKGYWWGSRVWLSRTTIRNIGEGVGLAGIWIPKHVIAASVATMGWALTKVPGGVVFNWTPGLPSPIWGNEQQ